MPKEIISHPVINWGNFYISGRYFTTPDGETFSGRAFHTGGSYCRQTVAYDVGRELEHTIERTQQYDEGDWATVDAFLLSKQGSPLVSGLTIKYPLPRNYLRFVNNQYIAPEQLGAYQKPYQHQVDFDKRWQTAKGQREIRDVLWVVFGLFNAMVHGPSFKPPKNMIRIPVGAPEIYFKGSNVFLTNRMLLHGLMGVIRDTVDFCCKGYTVADMGLNAKDVREALDAKNKRKLKFRGKKMVAALAAFRRKAGNTPFGSKCIDRMTFLADQWAGSEPHGYNITTLKRKDVWCSYRPSHRKYGHQQKKHTILSHNFLQNWTTDGIAWRKWWENGAKFTRKFNTQYQHWLATRPL